MNAFTISFTLSQQAGVAFALEQHNSERSATAPKKDEAGKDLEPHADLTEEEYCQKIFGGVLDSWARQADEAELDALTEKFRAASADKRLAVAAALEE